jgi:hypothetical protein
VRTAIDEVLGATAVYGLLSTLPEYLNVTDGDMNNADGRRFTDDRIARVLGEAPA